MKSKTIVVMTAILIATLLAGMALAVVIYQLDVSNTCKLAATPGLELRDNQTNVITSYAWGNFTHLQYKKMCSTVGDGYVYLWNNGNGAANISWTSTLTSAWWIRISAGQTMVEWPTGTYQTIAVGQCLRLEIQLVESSAIGGLPYTWMLSFKQDG